MSQQQGTWLMNTYASFHRRHERLKNYVHNGFRYPLPPWGRAVMGFVYFTLPVIGGYHVMQWAISKSHEEIGERGEKLRNKRIEGIGDKVVVDEATGQTKKVGAGGWGGGVNLAVSNETIQERNLRRLKKWLKKQRKLKRKREKEEAAKLQQTVESNTDS
ncbi:expressed unknown protein [Seminavis robusta]|uniref:Uncharacterized protein n=1 Tax=Seminavis robusta TaxID=568900 RepID=A0A9N8HMH3_9STRA|nr:expressed unknown protein [Seminavis robusta]|eukprot:Sro898_g217690.1 n/a (160) ;mRNA; r:42376-42958